MIWTNKKSGYVIPADSNEEPYTIDIEKGNMNVIYAIIDSVNVEHIDLPNNMFLYCDNNNEYSERNTRASKKFDEKLYGNVILMAS